MKFSTKEDIEAPIEAVFKAVSNFEAFERAALRRGARVQRLRHTVEAGPTTAWNIEYPFRGKKRQLQAELDEIDPPHSILAQWVSGGIEGVVVVDLVALSRNRTRLGIAIEFKPKTLSARLLVQSLRLGKTKLTARYRQRVAKFATQVEGRYKDGKIG